MCERSFEMKEYVLDCLGDACPESLVKTENRLKELDMGEVLIVQVDHICAMKNLPDWARKNGQHVEIEEIDDGEWEIIIEKVK